MAYYTFAEENMQTKPLNPEESSIKKKSPVSGAVLLVLLICGCLFIFYVFDLSVVEGESMEPLLSEGRIVLICRIAYGLPSPFTDNYVLRWKQIRKNDIIVYRSPVDRLFVIKRCVGISGDFMKIKGSDLIINNLALPMDTTAGLRYGDMNQIPQNMVLTVGDNYSHSVDSRHYGLIPVSAVRGKALLRTKNR